MSQPSPTVSVILPFFNAEKTLSTAVDSILKQTFADFELLLINNASTDTGDQLARAYATADARVHAIAEPRKGIAHALNTGLSHARAPLIARMDADDYAYPQRLQRQVDYLQRHPDLDVLACRVAYAGPASEGLQAYVDRTNLLLTHQQISLSRFIDAPLVHPSVMFRKKTAGLYGGYRQGAFPEDFELWLRWLEAGVSFEKLPESLLRWQDHPMRLTRQDERYSTEAFFRIKSGYLFRWLSRYNPFHPEVVVWGAGRKSRQRLRTLQEAGVHIRTFVDIRKDKTTMANCIHFRDLPPAGGYFILSNVANRGQGARIRQYLLERNYREGHDFLLMA